MRWEESAGRGARTSEKHRCRDRRPGRHQLRRHDVDDVAFGVCVTEHPTWTNVLIAFLFLYVCIHGQDNLS